MMWYEVEPEFWAYATRDGEIKAHIEPSGHNYFTLAYRGRLDAKWEYRQFLRISDAKKCAEEQVQE